MELVAVLMASYPYAKPSPKTYEVYERAILDLDAEVAQFGVSRLIATQKFLPTISDIRAAAVDAQAGHKRLGGEAWGDVGKAIGRFGAYRLPTFEDPLTAEAVRIMGWKELCASSNVTADRARFVELYDGLTSRARTDAAAGESLALPSPKSQGPSRRLQAVPGFAAIGSGKTL